MKNYVISLSSAKERREHIIQEFSKQGIAFEFFDAVTPSQVTMLADKFSVNIQNADLTQGELACLFSHICLWKKCIDENLDYIAIFEDDIYLGKEAYLFLNNDYWIPKDCQIIKLEMFDMYKKMSFTSQNVLNRKLRALKDIHIGAGGYILSQNKCQFFLEKIKNKESIKASDHIIFDDYLIQDKGIIHQLIPALCAQSDRISNKQNLTLYNSSLEKDRRKRINQKMIKPSKQEKIKRELLRIFRTLYHTVPKTLIKLYGKIGFQ